LTCGPNVPNTIFILNIIGTFNSEASFAFLTVNKRLIPAWRNLKTNNNWFPMPILQEIF